MLDPQVEAIRANVPGLEVTHEDGMTVLLNPVTGKKSSIRDAKEGEVLAYEGPAFLATVRRTSEWLNSPPEVTMADFLKSGR